MNRIKSSLLVILSVIIILSSNQSLAQTSDYIIKQNEKAPFAGILVPEDHYRKYSEALDDRDFVNKQLANPDMTICPEDHSLTWMLSGLAGGLLLGILINR